MRLRTIFVVGHSALLLVASLVYVVSHGGMDGDYVAYPGNDVIGSLADVGQVLFNRWQITLAEESWVVQTFLYLNLPSLVCARWIYAGLAFFVEGFDGTAFPFGLSIFSYIALTALPLTFLQWYWIGRLTERLRSNWKRRTGSP
jgi:hypothetical protein